MSKESALAQRMKNNYELRTRSYIPRRTYTIIRLDGKAFHSYTRGLKKPFDHVLAEDIDNAVIKLMSEIQGAQFAYCQSDEISVLVTDFAKENTCAWFDGSVQKITSVSASILTAEFNKLRFKRAIEGYTEEFVKENGVNLNPYFQFFGENYFRNARDMKLAYFDSRVFSIPEKIEVMNYFRWRNQDCVRNSISMVAQSMFSNKELHGKDGKEAQEMIFQKSGKNWWEWPEKDKNGRVIVKVFTTDLHQRSKWASCAAWDFCANENILDLIPIH